MGPLENSSNNSHCRLTGSKGFLNSHSNFLNSHSNFLNSASKCSFTHLLQEAPFEEAPTRLFQGGARVPACSTADQVRAEYCCPKLPEHPGSQHPKCPYTSKLSLSLYTPWFLLCRRPALQKGPILSYMLRAPYSNELL